MKKVYVFSAISVGLLCLAQLAFGQSISPTGASSFSGLFTKLATDIGGVVAGLGTVMFIVAGIFYVTSGGSPERMGVAKKTLIYAIIGMAVGFGAEAIVAFVKTVTG